MIITLLQTILYAGIAVILAGVIALWLCCWALANRPAGLVWRFLKSGTAMDWSVLALGIAACGAYAIWWPL